MTIAIIPTSNPVLIFDFANIEMIVESQTYWILQNISKEDQSFKRNLCIPRSSFLKLGSFSSVLL